MSQVRRNRQKNKYRPQFLATDILCGKRGIRTPGTVIPYVSLANWWFKPLTHLSKPYTFRLFEVQI